MIKAKKGVAFKTGLLRHIFMCLSLFHQMHEVDFLFAGGLGLDLRKDFNVLVQDFHIQLAQATQIFKLSRVGPD